VLDVYTHKPHIQIINFFTNTEEEFKERKKYIWFLKISGHTLNKPKMKQIGYVSYKGQIVNQ